MAKKRHGVGDITEGHIFHLVVGYDFFGEGFGSITDAPPGEREERREEVREKMQKAWEAPDVRRRTWKRAEEEGYALPAAARLFGIIDEDDS